MQILGGSVSSVRTATIARVDAFCEIFRDLQIRGIYTSLTGRYISIFRTYNSSRINRLYFCFLPCRNALLEGSFMRLTCCLLYRFYKKHAINRSVILLHLWYACLDRVCLAILGSCSFGTFCKFLRLFRRDTSKRICLNWKRAIRSCRCS